MLGVNGIFLSWSPSLLLSSKTHSSSSDRWKSIFLQRVVKCWYLRHLLSRAWSSVHSSVHWSSFRESSSADSWGNYYPVPDLPSTVLSTWFHSESCQVLISEALIIPLPIFHQKFFWLESPSTNIPSITKISSPVITKLLIVETASINESLPNLPYITN